MTRAFFLFYIVYQRGCLGKVHNFMLGLCRDLTFEPRPPVPFCLLSNQQHAIQNLDEETMTCKSSGVMKTLAWVFGVFFGITEMAGHFLR